MISLLTVVGVSAQANPAKPDDPPVASLITVTVDPTTDQLTVNGNTGAVPPAAQVAIRNLYTGATSFTQAGLTGQFTATIEGRSNTPLWISPAPDFPPDLRTPNGSVPGGPGTIIYAPFPETRRLSANPITQLMIDGQPEDWTAYPNITIDDQLDALRNLDAIYLRVGNPPPEYAQIQIGLLINDLRYNFSLDPRQTLPATWQQLESVPRDLGAIGVVGAATDQTVEVRIPLTPVREQLFNNPIASASLVEIAYLDADANVLQENTYSANINVVNEQSGIVYLSSDLGSNVTRFSIGGSVAQGASSWAGRVRWSDRVLDPGDTIRAEFDIELTAPDLSPSMVGIDMIGQVGLQPVALQDGFVTSAAQDTNRGWSTYQTPSGLPITHRHTTIPLGEVRVPASQVIRQGDKLLFGMPITLTLPDTIPPGLYVPIFQGWGQVGDSDRFAWKANGLLGEGDRDITPAYTRLPFPIHIGRDPDQPIRLLWSLFHAHSSNGSLGIIPQEDQNRAALGNNIQFNSPTHILPPGADAPLEPHLINIMPNAYHISTAPLLPLLFPNGRVNTTIQRPDGDRDTLGSVPVIQNVLSTGTVDERTRFGTQAPLDVYRLATLTDTQAAPTFDQYGEYTVELSGFVEDVWGNRYEGGGTYSFVVAETLDMTPAVLPGTPFETGDTLNLGLHVAPGVPATVTVSARLHPLDGTEIIEQQATGTANPYGVFIPDQPFRFTKPGEYVIDYEARYTDTDDRLWAGSLRTAGVVGSENATLVAHGERGLTNTPSSPAWLFAEVAGATPTETARFYAPYHNGDIAWITDTTTSGLQPAVTVQDTDGAYAAWLAQTHPGYTAHDGTPITVLNQRDTLPVMTLGPDAAASAGVALQPATVVNDAYAYLSYVTPSVTARQAVLGAAIEPGELFWDMNDPLLEQIGAGANGLRPGDYTFLFGGAVVRNPQADLQQAAIYSAMSVVIGENDDLGGRVFPPYQGAAGGPDGGPLLTLDGEARSLFFHPTSIRPGDVMITGDRLTLAGQVAPPLASNVDVTITAPSGAVTSYSGRANAIGHFYRPSQDILLDEPGVWDVAVTVTHTGASSASETTNPPHPTHTTRYPLYVVPAGNDRLNWGQANDIPFPIGLYNFTFDIPDGWTNLNGYLTVTMPGAVIENGPYPIQGTAMRYQLNPQALNARFPNYEGQNARVNGPASSDPLTLTFVFTGQNPSGAFDVLARQVLIRHDRLLTIE